MEGSEESLASTIRTYTGEHVNQLDPFRGTLNIEDVARASSRIPRFLGHTRKPYYLGEHCIRVSYMVWPGGYVAEMKGLMHDSPEAWLGDMPTPVKHSGQMDTYLETEKKFDHEVALALMPGIYPSGDIFKQIKPWDKLILQAELRDLFHRPKGSTAYAEITKRFPELKITRTMPSWVVYRFFKWRYELLLRAPYTYFGHSWATACAKRGVLKVWKWWYNVAEGVYMTPDERAALGGLTQEVQNA